MNPEIDQILNLSALKLMTDLAPAMGAQYDQGMTQVVAALLIMSAQEYDRAADVRAAENADMRVLFAELAPVVGDADLRRELEEASAGRDESLRVSALNAANERLRRLLIRLQVHIEDSGGDTRRIWEVLKAMAGRRTLVLPG
ncbi:MAG TPA: hypothetical protein VG891_05875 [Rhizomicrobium sp.]|jgi:hypothetical protein|nr:hypothetical protein [Rhizomicrobium sp.]